MTRLLAGMICNRRCLGLALALIAPATAAAEPTLCETAAQQAAAEFAVPLVLMQAIAMVETGRSQGAGDLRPWPWTLNVNGDGHWFSNADQAATYLSTALAAGAGRVDVGCFQLNVRWHGDRFATPGAMLDPLANARHAAGFLAALQRETGDWLTAAGAYHSRRPDHAAAYRARISAAMELGSPPVAPPQVAAVPPPRDWQPAAPGSLQPARAEPARPLLLAPPGRLIGG